ncbi:MAG TPA: DUF1175 family protein [Pyrinomonadaceae bacterium]|nr:DUF1175 family protein [Pyrinomonadaceae bacterium]
MIAFLKRRQFIFVISFGFALLLVLSYFTLGHSKKIDTASNLAARSARNEANGPTSVHGNSSLSLDSDNDGLPDAAELQSFMDRQNFRQWFTLIAENQFYRISEQWNAGQRDCAGLVRFAWREALRRHDRGWFQKMGAGYGAVAPDVSKYTLEQGPLGEKLFRNNFGIYKDGDVTNGTFTDFADGRTLKNFNVKFISRDRRNAQPGDLLFFYQPWVQKFPYHVMIFLGPAKLSAEQSTDWVVYHTGSSPTDDGTVKKVELSVLDHHPNKRWRPVESNPNFLGFYRLKILD